MRRVGPVCGKGQDKGAALVQGSDKGLVSQEYQMQVFELP